MELRAAGGFQFVSLNHWNHFAVLQKYIIIIEKNEEVNWNKYYSDLDKIREGYCIGNVKKRS